MNQSRILIVDDEPNIRYVLERTLSHEAYSLDTAANGAEALRKIKKTPFDLILLDLSMKPIDGIQVLDTAHEQDPDIVVIILTAHSSIESAVDALRLGAFDYLFKPATPEVIRQRVSEGLQYRRQTLRQRYMLSQIEDLRQTLIGLEEESGTLEQTTSPARFLRINRLVIDRHHRVATLDGRLLNLTTTEFEILTCLVEAAPKPVAPRQLVIHALDYDPGEAEAREIIKYHIHQLRGKIETDMMNPTFIKTVRYKGYLWSGG